MSLSTRTLAVLVAALLGLAGLGRAAPAEAAGLPTHVVPANANDPGIDTSRGANEIWLGPAGLRAGKLLVIMAGGGATNFPSDWRELGAEGARLGYHTIVLAYKNEFPLMTAPPLGCGPGVDPPADPPNCAINAHMEILDGLGESPVVDVTPANSILNRLTKALQYLDATYPDEGWSRFLDTSGAQPAPSWAEIAFAGQSLGGAEADLIGMLHGVDRVANFGGFTDAKHGWAGPGATPADRHFAVIHQRDNFFERACYAYLAFGIVPGCPLAGFTIPPPVPDPANPLLVDNSRPPFGPSHVLVIDLQPASLVGVNDPFHTSVSRDGWIAREPDLTPSRKLLDAWRYVLGGSDVAGAQQLLAGLHATVAGFGLDTGLEVFFQNRIGSVETTVGNGSSPCAKLGQVVVAAIDKAGKGTGSLAFGEAVQLLDATNQVAAVMGCVSTVRRGPDAEDDLVHLLGAMDGMSLSNGETNSLAAKTRLVGDGVVSGPTSAACTALAVLTARIDADTGKNKLTAAQGATLSAAAGAIAGELAC